MELLIRASQLGKITTGISLSPIGLTEKQQAELDELVAKGSKSKKIDELISKKNEIPKNKLSAGAKTYIQSLWYENHFGFRKNFTNKYVQKGNDVEDKSIDSISDFLGFITFKNEEHLKNGYIQGTPDIRLNLPKCTIDTKNVYYPDGLHFFDFDKDISLYEWQIHGYNFLDNKRTGFIARILMNPTNDLLEKEVWTYWKQSGSKGEPTESFRSEVKEMFNFESRPINERINMFRVDSTDEHFEVIKFSVNLAREYYEILNDKFKYRNQREVEFFINK